MLERVASSLFSESPFASHEVRHTEALGNSPKRLCLRGGGNPPGSLGTRGHFYFFSETSFACRYPLFLFQVRRSRVLAII